MTKEEIKEEIENLKLIWEFHSEGFIKDSKEFEKHINDIFDRIAELEKELKK